MSDNSRTGRGELLDRLSVVMVRPREASNVGAVARLMANFGARNGVLVGAKCDSNSVEARHAATGSGAVTLATMREVKSLQDISGEGAVFVAVTTDAVTRSKDAVSVGDVVAKLRNGPVFLVFGGEETGLSDADYRLCAYSLRISVMETSANLNLSHAVAVVLSRIFEDVSHRAV